MVDDSLYKLDGLDSEESRSLYNEGIKLRNICYLKINDLGKFRYEVKNFLKEVSDLYVIGMLSCDR